MLGSKKRATTTKKSSSKKDTQKLNVQIVDMHCRVMTDLFGEDNDSVQSWRIFRIMSEFVEGFEILRKYSTAATFMGSARTKPGDPYYKAAENLAALLAKSGFVIITGGGNGIMEAANVGAFKVGGKSVGLNIKLPNEQKLNPYTTDSKTFNFFFSRKVMLSFASEVYIYFPGGYGTMDEFFEIITLVQTGKITKIPIVLYGADFWNPLIAFIKQTLLRDHKAIDKEDLDLFHVVDSVEEAYKYVTKHVDPCAPQQV